MGELTPVEKTQAYVCDELPDYSCYDGLLWWYQADLLCRGPSIDIDDLDSWTFENWAQWYVVGVEWSSLCGSTLPPWATVIAD